jgi:hypothetical protein
MSVRVALILLCDFIMGVEIRRAKWTSVVLAKCLMILN